MYLKKLAVEIMGRISRLLKLGSHCLHDHLFQTYCQKTTPLIPFFTQKSFTKPLTLPPSFSPLFDAFQDHYFDLLGSGWQGWDVKGKKNPINLANRLYAKRLSTKITADYHSIDWHLDIRSGYRWQSSTWSRFIIPARPMGVDIKMPWELSRMHHLPLIALNDLSMILTGHPSSTTTALEFQNQVLDFISSNPPRFGVNWRTPMDVAIRAANWTLAYSIYTAAGYKFMPEFEAIFSAGLRDHGRLIVQFMEWDPHWRANHYLANICGLIFIAALLQRDKETDSWLAFAVQELTIETQRQIQEDGSVFEASTGYHRLSVEMVVYATAVVLGLINKEGCARFEYYLNSKITFPKPLESSPLPLYPLPGSPKVMTPFPESHFRRLRNAARFAKAITKPNSCVALIGDNDSGRFFRLDPSTELLSHENAIGRYNNLANINKPDFPDSYTIENQLDFQHITNAISAIISDKSSLESQLSKTIDYQIVQALTGGLQARVPERKDLEITPISPPKQYPKKAKILKIPIKDPTAMTGLCVEVFSDFGLYVFKSSRFFLSIRCGAIGQEGYGGHAHNDQLAIELNIDGQDLIKDPGVYRYTVSVKERRDYRSINAHFCPRVAELEPGNLDIGPWRLGDEAQARVDYLGENYFEGSHVGFGKRIHRQVIINHNHIVIADWGDNGLEVDDPSQLFSMLDMEGCLLPFCPGYGIRHS